MIIFCFKNGAESGVINIITEVKSLFSITDA